MYVRRAKGKWICKMLVIVPSVTIRVCEVITQFIALYCPLLSLKGIIISQDKE